MSAIVSVAPGRLQDVVQPGVTIVTALAQAQDISDTAYRDIYARVAQGRSLRNIGLALRSEVSFGWWAKYAAGKVELNRERKNELRRWATANGGPDLPDLPLMPAEAMAGRVHPDAAVYHVGREIASRVVLVGLDVPKTYLRINGNCAVIDDPALALESHQAGCNGRYSGQFDQPRLRVRRRYFRPCLAVELDVRILQLEALTEAAKRELGERAGRKPVG